MILSPNRSHFGGSRASTLGELLRARGFDPGKIVAVRNTLHLEDMSSDFKTIDDVVRANALSMIDRMQDGPLIPHDTPVLSFVALDETRARLTAFRRFMMRREGVVPGDIVYDYDAAHLLHSFIARAASPVFYDALDETGLDDLIGTLTVQWPVPVTESIVQADDAGLKIGDAR